MVEQQVFVAFLTFYMNPTSDIHWRSFVWKKTTPRQVENVITMFNHASYVFSTFYCQNRNATQPIKKARTNEYWRYYNSVLNNS